MRGHGSDVVCAWCDGAGKSRGPWSRRAAGDSDRGRWVLQAKTLPSESRPRASGGALAPPGGRSPSASLGVVCCGFAVSCSRAVGFAGIVSGLGRARVPGVAPRQVWCSRNLYAFLGGGLQCRQPGSGPLVARRDWGRRCSGIVTGCIPQVPRPNRVVCVIGWPLPDRKRGVPPGASRARPAGRRRRNSRIGFRIALPRIALETQRA